MKYGIIMYPINCSRRDYDYPSNPTCDCKETFGMSCPEDKVFPEKCPLKDYLEVIVKSGGRIEVSDE